MVQITRGASMLRRPRVTSRFCSTAILQFRCLCRPGCAQGDRFATILWFSPTRTSVFYAGAPLINEDATRSAHTLRRGTRAPRMAPDQRVALKALSRLVLAQLEFRRNLILLKRSSYRSLQGRA